MKHLPDVPAEASVVFGDRLPQVTVYARLLATDGVERGLIGPREVERLWDRHLLNSAAVSSEVPHGARVLDAGSGAGLPGIPIALARPDLRVTLVEPLLRRATFLTEVVDALDCSGLDVHRGRVEDLPLASAEVIVARAVAPLGRLATWTLPRIVDGGRLVAVKGRTADEEVAEAEATLRRLGARSWEVRDLLLPTGRPATRAVVVIAGDGRRQR